MNLVHESISFLRVRELLEMLNVTNEDDILVHGSTLDKDNCERVTKEIFSNGVSKKSLVLAPFMSILATSALLSDKYDIPSQIIDYNFGNVTFIIRIPHEHDGVNLGRINQKYARRTSGLQDESVCVLDMLDLESIPSAFIVGCIKKSNEKYGMYDFVVNPNYFELNKDKALRTTLEELVDNSDIDKMTSIVVKDYMKLEKADEEVYKGCLDFLSIFKSDSNFIKSLQSKNNKR